MYNLIKKISYVVLIAITAFLISAGMIFFMRAYQETKDSIQIINFVWHILLLGLVAGATIFAISRNEYVSKATQGKLFLSGSCAFVSTVLILIGSSIIYGGYIWKHQSLEQFGGFITDLGIYVLGWGLAMTFWELLKPLKKVTTNYFNE